MSWENIKKTGNGELEFRLVISGLNYEFVTNSLMVKDHVNSTGETVRRRNGLKRDGLAISEEIIIPENRVELEGNSFKIIDIDQMATRAFIQRASRNAELVDAFITDAQTTIRLSNNRISAGSIIWVGSEAMLVTAKDDVITPPSGYAYTVVRGVLNTTPRYHYTTTDLGTPVRPFVQNAPFGIENQRVELYAYGKADNLQGDGTLIWKGLVIEEASFDGMDWQLQAGPLTELFESEYGINSDIFKFRGLSFRYPWSIYFERLSTQFENGDFDSNFQVDIPSNSYFETVSAFLEALNTQINTNPVAVSWGVQKPSFQIGRDGQLIATFGTIVGESKFIKMRSRLNVRYESIVALKNTEDRGDYAHPYKDSFGVYTPSRADATGRWFVEPSRQYVLQFQDIFPNQFAVLTPGNHIIYVNQPTVTFPNEIFLYNSDDDPVFSANIVGSNPANRSIEIAVPSVSSIEDGIVVVLNNNHKFILSKKYFNPANQLPGFLRQIVQDSKQVSNQGILPAFEDDDFDLDNIQIVFDSLGLSPDVAYREFRLAKPSQTFADFFKQELRLIGCYPVLTQNGKITIRPFKNVTVSERKNHVLNADNILTDKSYPVITTNKYGIWNSIILKTQWDSWNEEHTGDTFTANNIRSISENNGKIKSITIEPYSGETFATNNLESLSQYVEEVMNRQTGLLQEKYSVVSVEVPMTLFSSSIGDTISIDSKQLPSSFSLDGTRRGQSTYVGFITKRKFELDSGYGMLEIFVTDEAIPASSIVIDMYRPIYTIAPTIPVLTASISASVMDIVVNDNLINVDNPFEDYSEYFSNGDTLELREFDSEIPNLGHAQFDSVFVSGGNTVVRISFTGSIPADIQANPSNYLISFDKIDETTFSGPSTSQLKFAYIDSGTKENLVELPKGTTVGKLKL